MGLKNPLRRRKAAKQTKQTSARGNAASAPPAYRNNNNNGAAASITDNSTIATKQTQHSNNGITAAATAAGGTNQYQQHPNYAKEEAPPQALPPLGLTCGAGNTNNDGTQGNQYEHSNANSAINANNIFAWQRDAAGSPDGADASLVSENVFAGLTLGSTPSVGVVKSITPVGAAVVTPSSKDTKPRERAARSRDRTAQSRDRNVQHAEQLRPTREPTPTEMHLIQQHMQHQVAQQQQQQHQHRPPNSSSQVDPHARQFDPPEQQEGKARKSHALKEAMRREISRHRGGNQSSSRRQPSSRQQSRASPQDGAPIIVAQARNKSATQKMADMPRDPTKSSESFNSRNPTRSGEGSLMMQSAAPSRGSRGNNSRVSRHTSSSKSTVVVAGTAAAAVVGVAAVGAVAASLRSERHNNVPHGIPSTRRNANVKRGKNKSKSLGETASLGDESNMQDEYEELPFPGEQESRDDDDEEEEHESAGSFCSCGGTYDEYDDDDDRLNGDAVTYNTYDNDTATYDNDTATYDDATYDNDPPDDDRSIGEESYMDESYMEGGSFEDDGTYNSDEDTSRRSVDPPANDGTNTWASWFGFGAGGSPGNDDSLMSPGGDDGSTRSGTSTISRTATLEEDEESTVQSYVAGDEASIAEESVKEDPNLAAKEEFDREIALQEKRALEKEAQKQQNSGGDSQAGSAIAGGVIAGAAVVAGVGTAAAVAHDREERPLPESKPIRRVASFKKSWKKLKSPGSKNNGGDKTVTSEDTRATASLSKESKSSAKETDKSSNGVNGVNDKNGVDKRFWDNDNRQRDIYCAKHGGVEHLTIRQYTDVPTPNAPDHVLVAVEASTVSSKDCVVRLKGDPNAPASPSVPGFHIVGEISALGSKVSSTAFRKGDRIAALLPNGGGNAKYVSIPVSSAILLPKNSNHQDTICLVANYMTAYQCLKLAKKDGLPLTNANVLITGGSGPVGQALVELALREGAKVYATAHKMHEEHLTKLGAKWFSVKPKKWIGYLEGKMDVVIDSLCVDGYESSYRALTPDGILVCNTGNISSLQLQNDPSNNGQGVCNSVFEDNGINTWWSTVKAKYFWNRAIFYDLNESYEENPKMFGHELHYLIIKLQRGEISPKVAGKVSLNQVPKAQKLIEKGLPNGTVVCLPWKKLDPKQKVKVEKIPK